MASMLKVRTISDWGIDVKSNIPMGLEYVLKIGSDISRNQSTRIFSDYNFRFLAA